MSINRGFHSSGGCEIRITSLSGVNIPLFFFGFQAFKVQDPATIHSMLKKPTGNSPCLLLRFRNRTRTRTLRITSPGSVKPRSGVTTAAKLLTAPANVCCSTEIGI